MGERKTREELIQRLSAAFEVWKSSGEGVEALNKAIGIALANGIDLVLGISDGAVNKTGGFIPISEQAVNKFAMEPKDGQKLFYVPSTLNKNKEQYERRLELVVVDDYLHKEPFLLIVSRPKGAFGKFFRNQVADLKPK